MPLQFVILYLLLSFSSASEDSAYCALRYSRLCQEKGQHIACQYPDPGEGESCENYTKIEFTEEMKNLILHYINRRRQRLAAGYERGRGGQPIPKPNIMMYVAWDRELAYLAQRLADQCRFVHDECRATIRYPYAGQTVGEVRWRRTRDSDELTAQRAIRKVFDAWWGEKRRVQPQQLTSPFKVTAKGSVWGHFTQLAIWKLRAVGCGAVRYGPSHPRLLLVCDYSHTNMLGQKTFTAGPVATCPPHTARRPHSLYPLLCSKIKYPIPQYEIGKFDYDSSMADEKEFIQSERTEEYIPDDDVEDEEDYTTCNKDYARSTDTDIYIKRTKPTGQSRRQESMEDGRQAATEHEYKDTDVYVQTRKYMKNIQQYQYERRASTTTHKYNNFGEERSHDIVHTYWDGSHKQHEEKSDFEEERRNNVMPKYRDGDHYDKNNDFEKERRNNKVLNYRNGDHYGKNNDVDEGRSNNIGSKYGKKNDFEEEQKNIIETNYRDYEKKIPHLSPEDYSVIPLKNRHLEQSNDVNIPWRPKLYHRTSTTEASEYETSIILVPKRKKGHRFSTGTAAMLPPNVMRNIVRTYHNRDDETRSTTLVREKDLLHTMRRPLAPSLKLDKEDIDQLFRDTGFKPNWTPKT